MVTENKIIFQMQTWQAWDRQF